MQASRPILQSRRTAAFGAPRPRVAAPARTLAAVSTDAESFKIPAAPDLIPDGPWKKVAGGVCAAKGFKATGVYAGLRASGKKADLSLVVADAPAVAAGAFTLNVMCAAPVTYCKETLAATQRVRAVLTNAGQANAATGTQGYEDSLACAQALADALKVKRSEVLLQSTGVIGRRMKMDAFLPAIPQLLPSLGATVADAHRCAVAITTTDLVSKEAALQVMIGGVPVHVGGMCKGSGMIHPNMATMLGVMTCDADVEPSLWRAIVKEAAMNSFNAITVDGDTSTNDTVIGLASGASGVKITSAASPEAKQLDAAVTALMQGLAKSIAWDGEGATCLMEIETVGAASKDDARAISRSVAGSWLTKCAVYGHDPNWGRIAAAAGYSGIKFDQNALGVQLGPFPLMERGQPLVYDAKAASAYLKETCGKHGTVQIRVTVGAGPGRGMAWGCDASEQYIKINSEYST